MRQTRLIGGVRLESLSWLALCFCNGGPEQGWDTVS
jgi:hypothetical protein